MGGNNGETIGNQQRTMDLAALFMAFPNRPAAHFLIRPRASAGLGSWSPNVEMCQHAASIPVASLGHRLFVYTKTRVILNGGNICFYSLKVSEIFGKVIRLIFVTGWLFHVVAAWRQLQGVLLGGQRGREAC